MNYKQLLLKKIESHSAVVGIIGMGYVGLPLALTFAEKGFKVIGFDIDEKKIPILNAGKSYIKHIPASRIRKSVVSKKFDATSDFSRLTSCDCILICVPTPLDEHQKPDLSFVENSAKTVAEYLQPGQLIVLESSTYPGTTEEILLPLFEKRKTVNVKRKTNSRLPSPVSRLTVGKDFFLAFSPEREDPGNKDYNTGTIPKLVGGATPSCLEVACSLYSHAVMQAVPVSSLKVAEAAKLLENIYRSVNIALVNELKMIFDRMNIDVWEVIEAAKTKPFGYHPFYPGPGLGGHCIPIDPFYLTWKAHEYDINTKFIELAGEINVQQPYYVVQKVIDVLNKSRISILKSKILLLGASYKKNIDDLRESPALKLIEILREKGAKVNYNDPYIPKLPPMRKYKFNMKSVSLTVSNLKSHDLILLVTDHDYYKKHSKLIIKNSKLVIDTRNAFQIWGIKSKKIFKA